MILITEVHLRGSKCSAKVTRIKNGIEILYSDSVIPVQLEREQVEGYFTEFCVRLDGESRSFAFRNSIRQLLIEEGE